MLSAAAGSSAASGGGGGIWRIVVVVVLSFVCELFDTALGMGYGTSLTPILLTPGFGFERKTIVQSILASEFVSGVCASLCHTLFGNMRLSSKKRTRRCWKLPGWIRDRIRRTQDADAQDVAILAQQQQPAAEGSNSVEIVDVEAVPRSPDTQNGAVEIGGGDDGEKEEEPSARKGKFSRLRRWVQKSMTVDAQVIAIMATTGCCGTVVSAGVGSIEEPGLKFAIRIYIGLMVLAMGAVIIAVTVRRWQMAYASWKIALLGVVTGFNKGISGGGYGPMSVSGQVIAGRPERNAIATTSAAEACICLAGILIDFVVIATHGEAGFVAQLTANYGLFPWMAIGSVSSVPFSAFATRIIRSHTLRLVVGFITAVLGCYSVVSASLSFAGVWNS